MPTIQNGKVTYAAGEMLPAQGSDAYKQAQSGQVPTKDKSPIYTPPSNSNTANPVAPELPSTSKKSSKKVAVATSNEATKNYTAQKTAFDGVEKSVTEQAEKKKNTPTFDPTISIVDLLSSQGKGSSFSDRKKLASEAGMQDYAGTADQNAKLIGYVNNQNVKVSNAPTDNQNGTPVAPVETPAPVASKPFEQMSYEEKQNYLMDQQMDTYEQYQRDMDRIAKGTFPLSKAEQAQIDATQSQFDEVKQLQIQANKGYEALQRQAQFREGTNLTDPTQFNALNHQAISDDIVKVNSITAAATKTLSELRQSFMDKDYKIINDKYAALSNILKSRADTIDKIQGRADKMANDLRDYNFKVQQASISNEMDRKKFNLDLAKSGFKFENGKLVADPSLASVSTKPATDAQNVSAGYADRTVQANKIINGLADKINGFSALSYSAQRKLPNIAQSTEVQQELQAERNFVNAVLRKESGAAISDGEFTSATKQYFPMPGDSKDVLKQKAENRELAIANLVRDAGPAYTHSDYDVEQPTPEKNAWDIGEGDPVWNPQTGYVIPSSNH